MDLVDLLFINVAHEQIGCCLAFGFLISFPVLDEVCKLD